MKLIKKTETNKVSNSPEAIMEEYLHKDRDINLAIGKINLILSQNTIILEEGDSVIIDNNEPFAWDGNATLLTVCTPAWEPSQHKEVKG